MQPQQCVSGDFEEGAEAERRLRLVAMGQNRSVGGGSRDAGHRVAVVQTMATMRAMHDVNRTTWLTLVLVRVGTTEHDDPEQLLPQNWQSSSHGVVAENNDGAHPDGYVATASPSIRRLCSAMAA